MLSNVCPGDTRAKAPRTYAVRLNAGPKLYELTMETARMPLPYSASAAASPTPTAGHRPRWWAELPLVLVIYAAYSAVRLLAGGDVSTAVEHGLAILRVEQALFLNLEHPLNRLFTSTPAIGIPADFLYAALHYVVTPGILVWLFRRRPDVYRSARVWILCVTVLGLAGFVLMPTCPPRLLAAEHGFVDTMAQYSAYGWWGGEASAPRGLGGMTNQYAAMPSLHVGWAVWCGVMMWRYARTPLVKWLGVVYPLVITVVVMGTANHYFLDAVGGAAVVVLGGLLVKPVTRAADRLWGARVRERRARSEGRLSDALGAAPEPGAAPVTAPFPTRPAAIVSGGCETSAGERFPGQRTRAGTPTGTGSTAGAGAEDAVGAPSADDTPATAR